MFDLVYISQWLKADLIMIFVIMFLKSEVVNVVLKNILLINLFNNKLLSVLKHFIERAENDCGSPWLYDVLFVSQKGVYIRILEECDKHFVVLLFNCKVQGPLTSFVGNVEVKYLLLILNVDIYAVFHCLKLPFSHSYVERGGF